MFLHIDPQSETPLYTQIVYQIIEGIASGQLAPGEALPSVRSLGADLGINLHTVNKAYAILKQGGYIQIHRQKGALVQAEPLPQADEPFLEMLKDSLRPLIAQSICRHVSAKEFVELSRQLYTQILGKGSERA